MARLFDVAILKSGGQYQLSDDNNAPLYVKVADMNTAENLTEITVSASRCICNENDLVPVGSIIFPKRGGAILTNKKRLSIRSSIAIDTNTMAMTPLSDMTLNYLKLWLDSFDLSSLCSGNVVPQINNQDLYPLLIPIPPIEEQRRIAVIVDTAFNWLNEITANLS